MGVVMTVIENVSSVEEAVGKADVYRKIAFRIMPLLMVCYVAAYLDRINIAGSPSCIC